MARKDIKPTSVRLPDELRTRIDALAARERRSISNSIEVALARYFACEEKKVGQEAAQCLE